MASTIIRMQRSRRFMSAVAILIMAAIASCDGDNRDQAAGRPGPAVLVVVAHPDDETALAATIYRIATELHGTVDELVITNGEGGYRYATLAEPYYGLHLTDEAVGRAHLPAIREEELRRATHILGVHELILLRQQDLRFTHDPSEPLERLWDVPAINLALDRQLASRRYDAVVGLLPVPETHGHHQAATILALRAVNRMPLDQRPVVFGVDVSASPERPEFTALAHYPETAPLAQAPRFHFDREHAFGFQDKLTYQIIVNWEIAEHKSQGTMQMVAGKYRFENFTIFAASGPQAIDTAKALFVAITPK
jgi:LmbE family N-acetylglucosaminyl deacetylase